MRKSITDLSSNLVMNRERWGKREAWDERDHFGYQWDNAYAQRVSEVAQFVDRFLRPHIANRYDLKILELSPGGGRFTSELIRYAASIDLLDMNQACLDICKERFKYFPISMRLYLNDGQSCHILEDYNYDLIASFDSMVHMHPDIIAGYVRQLSQRLKPGGILWLDHSGKGARELGHRTDMTTEKMKELAIENGMEVVAQTLRNAHDCISVLSRRSM